MKRLLLLSLCALTAATASAQVQVNDTLALFLDSLFMRLPEVMITGERPIVKAEKGKLVYDLPRMVSGLPVDNAYDAVKELPGVAEMGEELTLAGSRVNIIINGKISTLTGDQLASLLKTIPVSRIEKAEVMYAAPARYQVRGPAVNIVLNSGKGEAASVQAELYTAWTQRYYERLTERASLLYSSPRLSADLLYSYGHGRRFSGMEKEALHTVNGVAHPMNLTEKSRSRGNDHHIRLGADYTLSEGNILSLVYTAQLAGRRANSVTTGTENSTLRNSSDDRMHNVKADYHSSFGLKAGAEFTFYRSPGSQILHSILGEEQLSARYEDEQRINKWRFYLHREHTLKNGWGVNYGLNYTTVTDNSFQFYYDTGTREFQPGNSMKTRRKEFTLNGFTGVSKSFTSKLSADISLAAELYHSDRWHDWMAYPTLNLNYTPAPGHAFQLSFTTDRSYPPFWSMNNSVAYLSAYSEIHGNPHLKPSTDYQAKLTYIRKGKYVFTAFFNHEPDYSVQMLYQRPDRLTEVYKVLNLNFKQQAGLQATVPVRVGSRLNSRFSLTGYYLREKDDDFWDIPFDRDVYSFIASMSHTLTLLAKPDIRLIVSGFYQNGAIQGIYDLGRSGALNASLLWTFARDRARLSLKGNDLFETSSITPRLRYEGQNATNRFLNATRAVELSFSYKIGDYKEKERSETDTSRFK